MAKTDFIPQTKEKAENMPPTTEPNKLLPRAEALSRESENKEIKIKLEKKNGKLSQKEATTVFTGPVKELKTAKGIKNCSPKKIKRKT